MVDQYGKTLPEVVTELKEEVKEFAATRLGMLRAELKEKLQTIKLATPTLVMGFGLLVTAWMVLTGCLICLIAKAFEGTGWQWVIAFGIVGVLYAGFGAIAATFGWKALKESGVKPERTIRVLKQDQIWLQTEAKTQV